ncbi:Protein of unknown function DUF58 [Alkalibacterium putridalgicola]|uniref:Uncharacterized protein n=1 Tax=Alkalibacterium putridalgicola TaxID=426703 RepID=A0A1H7VDT5_9LACT|nr:DUF58 domain-containing protein [Alkalibacterium putridalgicola]GEK89778.1 hypothetical protein APU01nite_18170 [Alkalibacterium putridalgicola]SEM07422.1 Protein of unknown function DUF58 [Alkalibacterium putridalgicola]
MKNRYRYFRLLWIVLLYALVILYTLIFPTTASWFILYAFTLWLLLSFLSTRQSYHLTRTDKLKKEDNTFSFNFFIENKRRQPFLLSSIEIILVFNDILRSSSTAVFFSRKIESQFHSITLPRGHHETLTLNIVGTGWFGVWKKRSQLVVPINIDVYPDVLRKFERDRLMYYLASYLTETSRSLHHDYYMTDIRDFQNRDALSGIDWKTSLKRGQWMVKEYEAEEETPVNLYVFGFDTESFETLLSIAYSLLMELKKTKDVTLFLLGEFYGKPTVVKEGSGFLTIQPAHNKTDLLHLWEKTRNTPSKKIIIKSSQVTVPVSAHPSQSAKIIDEEILPMIKGGESDSEQENG